MENILQNNSLVFFSHVINATKIFIHKDEFFFEKKTIISVVLFGTALNF